MPWLAGRGKRRAPTSSPSIRVRVGFPLGWIRGRSMQTADSIPSKLTWAMPVVWCAVTATIIASGLAVQLGGGTGASFGYVFDVMGHGMAFRQGLALYGLAAAVLGAGFMFVPKLGRGATRWNL